MLARRVALLALSATLLFGACAERSTAACSTPVLYGTWRMVAVAHPSGFSIVGNVVLDSTGSRTELIGTSGEGTAYPLNYPVDGLVVTAESVEFQFAPLGIRVQGRCLTVDSIAVRFLHPQPPFDDIAGSGFLIRAENE